MTGFEYPGDFIKAGTQFFGTFLGAVLAFYFQRKKSKIEDDEDRKDLIIKLYRETAVNLELCATYRNTFFLDFNYGLDALETICAEILDAPPARLPSLQNLWRNESRPWLLNRFLDTNYDASTLMLPAWERLTLIDISTTEIDFVAKGTPDILRIVGYLKSCEKLVTSELARRDDLARAFVKYAGKREPLILPDIEFAKDLFALLRLRSSVADCLNKMIFLNTAVLALCEDHYFRFYGPLDFSTVHFDKGILSHIKPLEQYGAFVGSERSIDVVREKLEHEKLRNQGRRELIYKTSRTPVRMRRVR